MRKYMIVASEMPGYAKRLGDSLENKGNFCLMTACFTTPEDAVRFCRNHPVSVILADEEWMTDGVFAETPGAPRLIGLSDEGEGAANSLYRYQSVDEMIRKLAEVCGEAAISGPTPAGGRNVKLTAVYSPAFPSLKTAFAMTLAAMEKRFRKTLYLNLEEFGGCGILLPGYGEKNLSDAVYYMKQDALDSRKLASMVISSGSVDYIPPMPFADDVREADGEDWVRLLTRIAEISDYEEIVVDLPQSLFIASDVIDACDELYIPVGGDCIQRAKMKELETWLERPEHRRIQEKVRKIPIRGTAFPETETTADYPEELLYGPFGEELIREVPLERK